MKEKINNLIDKHWKKSICLIIFAIVMVFSYKYGNSIKEKYIYFYPIEVLKYGNSVDCNLTHSSGVYFLGTAIQSENKVKMSNFVEESTPMKMKFENLDQHEVNVTMGDSISLTNTKAYKVYETKDVIHLIGSWGIDQTDIQTFTIYKKTGFFTYTRSGDLMLVGQSVATDFGRCY